MLLVSIQKISNDYTFKKNNSMPFTRDHESTGHANIHVTFVRLYVCTFVHL